MIKSLCLCKKTSTNTLLVKISTFLLKIKDSLLTKPLLDMKSQCITTNMFLLLNLKFVSHVADVSNLKRLMTTSMIFTLETWNTKNNYHQMKSGLISWTCMIRNITERILSIPLCWLMVKNQTEEFTLLKNYWEEDTDKPEKNTDTKRTLTNLILIVINTKTSKIWTTGEETLEILIILTTNGFLKINTWITEKTSIWEIWTVIVLSTTD